MNMKPLKQSKPSKPSKPKFMQTIAAVSQISRVNLVEQSKPSKPCKPFRSPKTICIDKKDFIQKHFWANKILFILYHLFTNTSTKFVHSCVIVGQVPSSFRHRSETNCF